jgi:hypothetical protein
VSVVPPPDRLCLDLALSAWEAGDLCNAAVSIVVAGHPISSHTLLWPALVVEPAP